MSGDRAELALAILVRLRDEGEMPANRLVITFEDRPSDVAEMVERLRKGGYVDVAGVVVSLSVVGARKLVDADAVADAARLAVVRQAVGA